MYGVMFHIIPFFTRTFPMAELASFVRTLCVVPAVDSLPSVQDDEADEDVWPPLCLPLPAFSTSTSTSTWPSVSSPSTSTETWSGVPPTVPSPEDIEEALSASLCNGRSEVFLADLLLFFRSPQ